MIEAAEVPAVVARLHDRGLIPLSIASGDGARPRAAGVQLPALPALGRRRVKGRDLLIMTQELSALVGSGLPLDRSLATLADLADNPELKRILTEVLHAVQGGKSLAEALGQHRAFPPLYVNMIRAGEIGGFLELVLERLVEYLERGQQLRDEVRSALTYPLLRKMEVASLARTLGTLLKSGVPMLQALGIVKEVAGNQVIARSLGEVEVGVREGAGVAEPLARSGVFPPLAVQMIAVGEETGKLDELLIRVADHFDREVRVQILQFTRLLEPVLILVMGLGVGSIVISMLSAIFSVNDLPM